MGTDTPDYITPATATVLQAKLGAYRAGTFDVGCACASFPTALASASGLMAANTGVETVLVVGAYVTQPSRRRRRPHVLLLRRRGRRGRPPARRRPRHTGRRVRRGRPLRRLLGASMPAVPWSRPTRRPWPPAVTGCGSSTATPLEINEQGWPRLVRQLAERCGFAVDEIDHAIFTQVNRCTIHRVCDALDLPRERAVMIMEECGYTGSACVPMALDTLLSRGGARAGELVVLLGSGVGYNMAAVAVRIDAQAAAAAAAD
ncbi:MAG: 3-oxoacyl-[acyl-carrier-protein] synthase III C-terminal domain-containing protein [Arhodomonas sp.]|nr:3-oxoacyl-[acyl-carrier-protein] synthase III C-terminal domain-containing protein [Arhodomonas sp.]